MMAEGLVEEVRRLAKSPTGLSRTARQALGYREILAHLEQEQDTDLDDNVAQAVRRTRAFARRQRVWWRRDPRITWFGASENPLAVMPALLRDWTNA
jgi:tRNA dimethylallyltransferase